MLIYPPQRVFEITPSVPGSPSLDVKPYSPGGTRRLEEFRFKIFEFRLPGRSWSSIANRKSTFEN
ncbi:MAG: hypothetical protein DME96_04615 [Verrucomicrobia bacterium]|nr:MAG: hypothetical protein DME96_04615 [Verrucomicrobiota bacterium]